MLRQPTTLGPNSQETPEDVWNKRFAAEQEAQQRLRRGPPDDQREEDDPNLVWDLIAAPFRGVEQALQSSYDFLDYVTLDSLPDWNTDVLGVSQTGAGKAVEGISQFLTGFVPIMGVLGKIGKGQKVLSSLKSGKGIKGLFREGAKQTGRPDSFKSSLVAGAGADFLVFDGQQARLSNMVESVPGLKNPVTDFLAASEDDNEAVGRIKNTMEGLGLGALTDALVRGLRGFKKGSQAIGEGKDAKQVAEAMTEPIESAENITKPIDDQFKQPAGEGAAARPTTAETVLPSNLANEPINRLSFQEQGLDAANSPQGLSFSFGKQVVNFREGDNVSIALPKAKNPLVVEDTVIEVGGQQAAVDPMQAAAWRLMDDAEKAKLRVPDDIQPERGAQLAREAGHDAIVAPSTSNTLDPSVDKGEFVALSDDAFEVKKNVSPQDLQQDDLKQFLTDEQVSEAVGGDTGQQVVEQARKIQSIAKQNPRESGRVNLATLEGTNEAMLLINERAKIELASQGGPSARPLADRLQEKAQLVSDHTGKSIDSVTSRMRASIEQGDQFATEQLVAADYLVSSAEQAQEALRKAAQTGSMEDQLTALKQTEILSEFLFINGGFGTTAGRVLQARKFISTATEQTTDQVKQMVKEFGGQDYIQKQLDKLATAADSVGTSKLVRNQLTRGGRLLRAHNEYWINSILSGPQTQAINALSNSAMSIYLPFERLVGAATRGQMNQMRGAAKQMQYLTGALKDSWHYARQAWDTEANILVQDRGAVSDVVRQGAISARGLDVEAGSTLASFLDRIGKVTRTPSRFLMSSDEFFKQLNFRAAGKAKLFETALEQGLDGKAAAKWAHENFEGMIRESGEAFSESSIRAEAIKLADDQALEGAERARFIQQYTKDNFDKTNSVLASRIDASEFGQEASLEATFTRDLEPGTLGHSVQQFTRKHPVAQLLMPFVRTPTNLLKFVGQRTFPLVKVPGSDAQIPLLSKIWKRQTADLLGEGTNATRQAEANGRFAMGAGLWGMASLLYHQGVLTGGGPQDASEREILEQTGWQPYSIKLGDQYFSYQRMDPFATFLSVVSDWNEITRRAEDHTQEPIMTLMTSGVVALMENLQNKSYLAGLSQFVTAMDQPERYMGSLTRSRAGSYIPNVLGQGTVTLGDDEVMREYRTFFDATVRRLPGASEAVAPVRNILGEKVDAKIHSTPILGEKGDWFSPIATSKDQDDPVWKEIASLEHGFQKPSPELHGEINMLDIQHPKTGQTAYDRWLELHGEVKFGDQGVKDALKSMISSKGYQSLSRSPDFEGLQSPRIRQIRKVIGQYRRKALHKLMEEVPELKEKRQRFLLKKHAVRKGRTSEQIKALLESVNQ